MNKYYQNYHKHTSLSHRYNKDSPSTYKDYFKESAKLSHKGIPQIYSTVEHGWQSNYFKIYDDLEKFNKDQLKDNPNYKPIKFIFGTEAYWVKDRFEKDSSNCHIVLLAKNDNGRRKLNRAIYQSYQKDGSYYYKNRMDIDLLLSLPKDDIFVTSACIGFWLPYSKDNDFSEVDEVVLKLFNHFTDFYLELQANNTITQKCINKHILELHNKYNIPIIMGTDSHYINQSQKEDRDDLLRSNSISYPEEDGNYMDFPSFNELRNRMLEQGVCSEEEINEAIDNTNKILDFEDIVLDRSLKVPIAKEYKDKTLEERNEVFENILRKEWKTQIDDINKSKFEDYIKEIKNDIKEIESCNMADYFIDTYLIMKRGISEYGGILTPSGRGSAVSMYINKLLRFTKVDSINADVIMYPERFLTSTRIIDSHTPPDIDHNVSEREPFIQAQRDVIGEQGTYDLLALGTLKYKSAFKMYARAYNLNPQVANEVTKQISKYENALKYAENDEKDLIDIYDYVDKEKYETLIEGCKQYMGIIDTLKSHPCFTKDNLVMTKDGLKYINEIEKGEEVLTIDNTFHKVVKTMKRVSDDIYNLEVYGSPIINVTGNHPFYVSKRKPKRNKNNEIEMETPTWKDVSNLENGDMVAFAINQNSILPNLPFVDSKNNDFWWCMGRYLGDGWRSHTIRKSGKGKGDKVKEAIICCNKNNNDTNNIINHLGWCEYRISENKTTNKIYLKCKGLYDWLEIFGDYAYNKQVPIEVINLPKEQLKSFIDGYISADVSIDKNNNIDFITINKKTSVGMASCIHKVYNRPCKIKNDIYGNRLSFHIDDRKQDRAFYKDGYIWCPYQKKEKANTSEWVYNFEVEENHTYNVNNVIVHNCGTICSDLDIVEEVGVIMVKSESTGRECEVALIESGTIDAFGFLKQDYLVVDSIGLTYDIYKEIGIEPLSVNQLLSKINNDENVWDIYKNGYTMCVNQCEQNASTQKVMRYKPHNISELTQFIAGIRPSFKSMYKTFENREHFDYGIKVFDNLLQDEFCQSSFILYQESLMKVLGFAGFPMNETYTIIKAISKKKDYIIKDAKSKFINNFAKVILDTKETTDENNSKEMAEKVWQIIEDSAQYGFNSAHAYCMAIDSVTLAWQKAYYPLEFYKVTLQRYTNKGNKDKVTLLKQEMLSRGFKLKNIKFGTDNRQFNVDKENNCIIQTMASIKDMQKIAPDILYELGKKEYKGLFFIFKDLLSSKLNKKSINILIELDYFSEYGDINYIKAQLEIYKKMQEIYNQLGSCKQLKKQYCVELGIDIEDLQGCCNKETEKIFKEIDNDKLLTVFKKNYDKILNNVSKNFTFAPCQQLEKIMYQIKILGYTDLIDETQDDNIYSIALLETNAYGTPFAQLYKCNDGTTTESFKIDRKWYAEYPLNVGDIVRVCFQEKEKKIKELDEDGNPIIKNGRQSWVGSGEIETIIKNYFIVKKS